MLLLTELDPVTTILSFILVVGIFAVALTIYEKGKDKVIKNKKEIRDGAETVIKKVRNIGVGDYEACINEIERKLILDPKYFMEDLEKAARANERISKASSQYIPTRKDYSEASQYDFLSGLVKETDYNEIFQFFKGKVDYQKDYISETVFLDSLGLENLRPMTKIIKDVEGKFWRNRISAAEVDKIKEFIIVKYIVLEKYYLRKSKQMQS
jgi:hypothetical protein